MHDCLTLLVYVKILATNVTEPTQYPIARDAFGWDVTPRRCRQFDACGCCRSGWLISAKPSMQGLREVRLAREDNCIVKAALRNAL